MHRKAPDPVIVSVGYQDRSIDDFVRLLTSHGVATLLDVRLNPISRKKGFSKTALREALDVVGIEYIHHRPLGNPKDNRDGYRAGLPSARSRYVEHLADVGEDAMDDLVERASGGRVAVMCYEREHGECHRSEVISAAVSRLPRLGVRTV